MKRPARAIFRPLASPPGILSLGMPGFPAKPRRNRTTTMLDREPAANGTHGKGHTNGTATVAAPPASEPVSDFASINPDNLAFVEQLYEAFLGDPASVDPAWRSFFAGWGNEQA